MIDPIHDLASTAIGYIATWTARVVVLRLSATHARP